MPGHPPPSGPAKVGSLWACVFPSSPLPPLSLSPLVLLPCGHEMGTEMLFQPALPSVHRPGWALLSLPLPIAGGGRLPPDAMGPAHPSACRPGTGEPGWLPGAAA